MPKKKKNGSRKKATSGLKAMNQARKEFAGEAGPKIITASKVKDLVKYMGMRCEKDFTDHVAREVYMLIWKAAKRTYSNDRKTIRGTDL